MDKDKKPPIPAARIASTVLSDGSIVELISRSDGKTAFAIANRGAVSIEGGLTAGGRRLIPWSGENALLRYGVVLIPGEPVECGTTRELVAEIRDYIHRHVDVSPSFEQITAYYVLLTWAFDRFNELPYLRLRGDYGSGKTRFLLTVGALCYRPIFASGASTVAPIFHSLNAFGGTLVLDEGDFKASDEKADIVKILNNGNVRGLPVLRMEVTKDGNYTPRAFQVFGPKIVATRGFYDDQALESRFITEDMGRSKRSDIPINLDNTYRDQARVIRSKLLMWRFRNYHEVVPKEPELPVEIEPRLRQILGPILSLVEDDDTRQEITSLAHEYQADALAERGLQTEAMVLEVIRDLVPTATGTGLSIGVITEALRERFASDLGRKLSNRWVGGFLRRNLRIKSYKSHGNYVVPFTEFERIELLCERFGVAPSGADVF